MKKLVILGATGSIGEQALEVVSGSDELAVVGLAAGSNWERLVEQARDHGVPAVALGDPGAAQQARRRLERPRAGRRRGDPRAGRGLRTPTWS